jgi:hypothetical protein
MCARVVSVETQLITTLISPKVKKFGDFFLIKELFFFYTIREIEDDLTVTEKGGS